MVAEVLHRNAEPGCLEDVLEGRFDASPEALFLVAELAAEFENDLVILARFACRFDNRFAQVDFSSEYGERGHSLVAHGGG